MITKNKKNVEFGDFQTPLDLAKEIALITNHLGKFNTIVEPTCGIGTFIQAFLEIETTTQNIIGWEIKPKYVEIAQKNLSNQAKAIAVLIKKQDFFQVDWFKIDNDLNKPILFIGNPPWVTNSKIGKLLGQNLPTKNNFQKFSGLEALTGKSNFDISEWILIKICQQISNTKSSMAFLLKTSVARKIYKYIVENNLLISFISIRKINAKKYFNVSVEACLLIAQGSTNIPKTYICPIYENLKASTPYQTLGIVKGKLVSNINIYNNLSDIDSGCEFKWRSGIKHDAAKIMELEVNSNILINGYGQILDIPNDYLYPMYKSSNIAKDVLKYPQKMMLVTQKKISDSTMNICDKSPKTWNYLLAHANQLDSRKSSIYKNAPRFAIFGVGNYTFKPWKIVVSGLYKNIKFTKIGTFRGKPIVLDDTCYMLGFNTEIEADIILTILKSNIVNEFINSLIFKDNKRVLTASLLNRINFRAIALRLDLDDKFRSLFPNIIN